VLCRISVLPRGPRSSIHGVGSCLILYTATHDGPWRITFVCIPGGWFGPVHQAQADCVFGGCVSFDYPGWARLSSIQRSWIQRSLQSRYCQDSAP
jgi:hypothetical protein